MTRGFCSAKRVRPSVRVRRPSARLSTSTFLLSVRLSLSLGLLAATKWRRRVSGAIKREGQGGRAGPDECKCRRARRYSKEGEGTQNGQQGRPCPGRWVHSASLPLSLSLSLPLARESATMSSCEVYCHYLDWKQDCRSHFYLSLPPSLIPPKHS